MLLTGLPCKRVEIIASLCSAAAVEISGILHDEFDPELQDKVNLIFIKKMTTFLPQVGTGNTNSAVDFWRSSEYSCGTELSEKDM